MGVISIRTSTEKLNNLGQIRSPDLDNGAAQALRGQAAAYEKTAQGINAATQGIGKLAEVGGWWVNHEHQIRYEKAVAELRNDFNEYMYGDGKTPGQWDSQLAKDDPRAWAQSCQKKYDTLLKKKLEKNKITDHEWQSEVQKAAEPFRSQWAMRVAEKSAATLQHNAITTANLNLNSIEATLANGDGTPKMYDQWREAMNEKIDLEGGSDELKAAKLKRGGLKMCTTGMKNLILSTQAAADATPEVGAAIWDEKIKMLEENGSDIFVPPNAVFKGEGDEKPVNFVREWLQDADMENFRKAAIKDLKDGKQAWERNQLYKKSQAEQQLRADFTKREAELFKGDYPSNPADEAAYLGVQATNYKKLGEEAEAKGASALALSYYKTAQALTIKKNTEEAAAFKAYQTSNFERAKAAIEFGCYYDENLQRIDLNAEECSEIARQMLANKEIDQTQFIKLQQTVSPALDEEAIQIRDFVLDQCKQLVPNALHYNSRNKKFNITPSKKVRGSTKIPSGTEIPSKWDVKDGTEAATYADLAHGLNVALKWKAKNKKGVAETIEYFKQITYNVRDGQLRNNIKNTIDAAEAVQDAFRDGQIRQLQSYRSFHLR